MKAFSTFVLFVVLGFIMVGCAAPSNQGSSSEENEDVTTIEFVYWASAGGEEEAFKEMVEAFELENPDVKVRANQVPAPSNTGDYYTRIQTRMAANDSPDLFRIQYQKFGEFASEDALLDVTDLFEKEKEVFNNSLLTAVTFEERIYGLPHHTDTLAVFYNKTYLDELGVEAPESVEEAWTWDEFIEIANKIEEEGLATNGLAINWSESSAYRSLPFFYQNGAGLLNDELTESTADSNEVVETLSFLQDLYKNNMSQGNSMKGSDDVNMLFSSGNAGLLISGNWMIPKYEADMVDYEWGVTYMPVQASSASDLGGNGIAIPATSEKSDAAKRFLKFLGEAENMKAFVEKGLFLPSRNDITEPYDYAINDQDMMLLFIEQSQTVPEGLAQTVTSTSFSKINQALSDVLEELFISNLKPEDASVRLHQEIEAIVKD